MAKTDNEPAQSAREVKAVHDVIMSEVIDELAQIAALFDSIGALIRATDTRPLSVRLVGHEDQQVDAAAMIAAIADAGGAKVEKLYELYSPD